MSKVFKPDTQVKVISNVNGILSWKSNLVQGRTYKFLKAGTPKMIPFYELEDMVWSGKTLIQKGYLYVCDKEAFDATGIVGIEWESIKPLSEVQRMLKELDAETLREQTKDMSEASKELLAELVIEQKDDLKSSTIKVVEDVSNIKIQQMIEDQRIKEEYAKQQKNNNNK